MRRKIEDLVWTIAFTLIVVYALSEYAAEKKANTPEPEWRPDTFQDDIELLTPSTDNRISEIKNK